MRRLADGGCSFNAIAVYLDIGGRCRGFFGAGGSADVGVDMLAKEGF